MAVIISCCQTENQEIASARDNFEGVQYETDLIGSAEYSNLMKQP